MQTAQRSWTLPVCALTLVFWGLSATRSMAQLPVSTIALSGTAAPGAASGVKLGTFSARPTMNAWSQSGFIANYQGTGISGANNSAIYAAVPGALVLMVREGSNAPGTPSGTTFAGFGDPLYSVNNNLAFYGSLRGTSTNYRNDAGIWQSSGGQLRLVAREGSTAPGTPAVFSYMSSVVMNATGMTAWYGVLTGSGVFYGNDTGIWAGWPGSVRLVAREGSGVPGAPAGMQFASVFRPVTNDKNAVTFRCTLKGTGVNASNDIAIYSEGRGLVGREGSAAPGAGANFSLLGDPVCNNLGQVAFASTLVGNVNAANNKGIWAGAPGYLALVARKGLQAPGTASIFSDLSDPALASTGACAFSGRLTGGGAGYGTDTGIWAGAAGKVGLLARTGSAAPGAGGAVFDAFLTAPATSSRGGAVFLARLRGSGVTTANNLGLWATNSKGQLVLVARSGLKLVLSGGVSRVVRSLSMVPWATGGEDGLSDAVNGAGKVAFHASFTDGSQGIFQAAVP